MISCSFTCQNMRCHAHHSSGSSNVHTSHACDLSGSGSLTVEVLRWYASISSRITCSIETSPTSGPGAACEQVSTKLAPVSPSLLPVKFKSDCLFLSFDWFLSHSLPFGNYICLSNLSRNGLPLRKNSSIFRRVIKGLKYSYFKSLR